jgi:excisionase family DNA binding protein
MELLAKGQHMAELMLTLREVSDYLNVNPATVRRLVRSGQLRAIRVGRDMRFEVRVVDQWVVGWRHSSWGIRTRDQCRFRRCAQSDQVLVGLRRRGPSGFLQKGFDVTASKALDSPDRMTRQLAPPDHPVDGHRRKLQQVSELSDGIEFRRVVGSQSRSWHLFPSLSSCILINFGRYPLGMRCLCQAFLMLTINILLAQRLSSTVLY